MSVAGLSWVENLGVWFPGTASVLPVVCCGKFRTRTLERELQDKGDAEGDMCRAVPRAHQESRWLSSSSWAVCTTGCWDDPQPLEHEAIAAGSRVSESLNLQVAATGTCLV